MRIYTKDSLIQRFKEIQQMGWVPSGRQGNVGGVGNTLEDFLEIEENNLPLPNAGEWELKCQRLDTTSLITLFHMEPSPRAIKFVPRLFLPLYGWEHQTIKNEMSFRQTINGKIRSDRGFMVIVDRELRKALVSFDANYVSSKHSEWLTSVEERIGLDEISPQPYWGFDDLRNKAGTKLLNCFYIGARRKKEGGIEYFKYERVWMLQGFSFDLFLQAIEEGHLLVDFDARTGHNHGTKFRIKQEEITNLYSVSQQII